MPCPYPAISLATATVGRHRCPQKRLQTARQPPVYPNSSPDHRACNSLTPFRCPHAVHPCPSVDSGLYGAKYIILFPVFAYFWFAALTLILTLLSKDRSFSDILLIAFATVSAIRLAAYYNEELSRDMAKILPFAVLAIFLIDASFFKIAESLEALKEANDHRESIFYYLLFLIAVEFALRLILAVVAFLVSVRKRISQEPLADDSDGAPMPPPGEEPSQEDGDVGADAGSTGALPTTQSP